MKYIITRAVKYEGKQYNVGDEVPPQIARKIDKCVKMEGEKPKESFVMSLKQEAIKKKTTKHKK